MSIVELFKLLQKLREMTPSISNYISPNDLKANFDDIIKEINSLLPLAEKEVKDIKILLGVIQSLRKENESLKKQLVTKANEQDFNTQEWKTTDQSFANPILSNQLNALSSSQNITKDNSNKFEVKEEPLNALPPSQNITKNNSNKSEIREEPLNALPPSQNITKNNSNKSEIREEPLNALPPSQNITKNNSNKSEIREEPLNALPPSQNITKNNSNKSEIREEPSLKPRAQNIKPKANGFGFYDTKSANAFVHPATSKENIASPINNLGEMHESDYSSEGMDYAGPNMRDYYDNEETMKQLQIDAEELEDLVTRKRLSPQTINNKRYFGKKEVSLIRSLTMELSTIIMPKPKPKKKNPLQFWKD